MPRQPPPEHSRFKKGKSGNEGGRPKISESLRAINLLSKDEVNALYSKYVRMSNEEMLAASKDPKLPALECWIASGIVTGIKNGDWYNMEIMFNRIFGRPKQIVDASLLPEGPQSHIENPDAQPVVTQTVIEGEVITPRYVVGMNKNGKFLHSRPQLVQGTVDEKAKDE